METKHTAGPWEVQGSNPPRIYARDGLDIIAQCDSMKEMKRAEEYANASRIVACVNACEGIATDVLDEGVLYGLARAFPKACAERNALRAENERLKKLAQHVCAMESDAHMREHPEWHEICAEARAALKQEGKP